MNGVAEPPPPPGLVTTTLAAPVPAGVIALRVFESMTPIEVAVVPPNVTVVVPATKLVPVILTSVPPAVGPYAGVIGVIAVTVGAATYVKADRSVANCGIRWLERSRGVRYRVCSRVR